MYLNVSIGQVEFVPKAQHRPHKGGLVCSVNQLVVHHNRSWTNTSQEPYYIRWKETGQAHHPIVPPLVTNKGLVVSPQVPFWMLAVTPVWSCLKKLTLGLSTPRSDIRSQSLERLIWSKTEVRAMNARKMLDPFATEYLFASKRRLRRCSKSPNQL